jgi:hypothetical protein
VKGLGIHVVEFGGPSTLHRVTVSTADIQPPLGVAIESPPTGTPMPLDQCIGSQLQLLVEGSTASTSKPAGEDLVSSFNT